MATAIVETTTSDEPVEQVEPGGDTGTARRVVAPAASAADKRRRIVDATIGEYAYDARCPKLVVWTDLATLIEDRQSGSNRAERRRADRSGESPGITIDRVRLTSAVQHFLRGCLSASDWAHVEQQLADPDADLDIPDLWAAGVMLIVEFRPDMEEMAAAIGMRVPQVLHQLGEQTLAAQPAPAGVAPRKAAKAGKAAKRK